MKISLRQARRIALHGQLLDGRSKTPAGKEGVAQTIEKLGYVQIDTIAAIRRAHHHTIWMRCPDYAPEMLHELQARDRRVFEYWGHAHSYLPMCDYRYYLPRMRAFEDPQGKWEKERFEKCGRYMKPVLERVRKEGPLSSRDFGPPKPDNRTSGWGGLRWNPTKAALGLLFLRGDLMVTERRGFERVFDLTERVLPNNTDTRFPDNDELGRFLVRRGLAAYGVAKASEIVDHICAADRIIIDKGLQDLEDAGEVVRLSVDNGAAVDCFALVHTLESVRRLRKNTPRLRLLSPFDNLIIQRDRIRWLFDFDYSLECYLPAPKRVHGYFVLPILWGEELVGRLDPKADHRRRELIIHSLSLEKRFDGGDVFVSALARSLADLAAFNDCENVTVEKTTPAGLKKELTGCLRKIIG